MRGFPCNTKLLQRLFAGLITLVMLAFSAASLAADSNTTALLKKAIDGPQRTPAFVKRDRYRHPLQTLEFFGIRPNMTVVEVLPGGGWYTEILAPFLHDQGHLIEATFPQNSSNPFLRKMADRYAHKLAADPQVYGRIEVEPFVIGDYMALGAPDSADMVVTFRNLHDLIFANVHGETTDLVLQKFLRSAYRTLKPGGILGVVAHRANPGDPPSQTHMWGRLPQKWVVDEAEKAGFKLGGSSEVNANPKDPRNIPVWTLPPTLNTKDKKKYEAMGEADNMTLRFIKPDYSKQAK